MTGKRWIVHRRTLPKDSEAQGRFDHEKSAENYRPVTLLCGFSDNHAMEREPSAHIFRDNSRGSHFLSP